MRDVIEMVEVLLCETEGDRAEAGWRTGDAVKALEMIKKDQAKAYEIMGADVKQSGEQFGKIALAID